MEKTQIQEYLSLLKSEISPALGCTEPAAVALAVAYAAKALNSEPEEIEVNVSQYIFKNGMNVGIPGTGMIGLDIAAALGALSAAPEKELLVLKGISESQKEQAKKLVREKRVHIGLSDSEEKVWIQAIVRKGAEQAEAQIVHTHTDLSYLRRNGEILVQKEISSCTAEELSEEEYTITLSSIVDFVLSVDAPELLFLREVIRLNRTIAEEGLQHDYGLKVGKSLLEGERTGLISNDIATFAVACTAAAADARMAGCEKPVMSTAGSGNQGLTASLPVAAIGWKLKLSEETVLRALALSILVTIHTKHYIGRLSVLCGCSIAASIGSCCGIIFLLGGNLNQMKYGINTMVADISGVVCDGAKPGCALKIATAVTSAIRAASMAVNNIGADAHDGIVTFDVEKTLENLGTLGNEGMVGTNSTILDMMLHK